MEGWKFLVLVAAFSMGSMTARSQSVALGAQRGAASDLEVTGLLPGIPPGSTRYVRLRDLEALPQTTITVGGGELSADLPAGRWTLTGVALDALTRALGAPVEGEMLEAVASDGYRGHLSGAYIKAHRPMLVLRIDGLGAHAWARKTHQFDPGPYLIANESFVPGYTVLEQPERAQLPSGVVRLEVNTEANVLGAIAPRWPEAKFEQVRQGYRLAQQNCFRCHNSGAFGGTKAGRTWTVLGETAWRDPDRFTAYIHAPQLVDPKAKMPANPGYDKATLAALTAYFRTFAKGDH